MSALLQALVLEFLRDWPKAGTAPAIINEQTIAAHTLLQATDVNAALELLKVRGLVEDCYVRDARGDFSMVGWMLTLKGADAGVQL